MAESTYFHLKHLSPTVLLWDLDLICHELLPFSKVLL